MNDIHVKQHKIIDQYLTVKKSIRLLNYKELKKFKNIDNFIKNFI